MRDKAVGCALAHGFDGLFLGVIFQHAPLRIIIGDVALEREIVANNGNAVGVVLVKVVLCGQSGEIEGPDRVGKSVAVLFGGEGILADMEDHIDVAVPQGIQLFLTAVKAVQVKAERSAAEAVRRVPDVVGEHAGHGKCFGVKFADTGIVVEKAEADRAVCIQPVLFLGGQGFDRVRGQIVLIQPLGIERLVVFDAAHGGIERVFQVGTAFADDKVNIRAAERGECGQARGLPLRALDRDKAVDLAAGELGGGILTAGDENVLGVQRVPGFPRAEQRGRNALLQHTDAFAVQAAQIGYRNIRVGQIGIEIVAFLAHGQVGEQHGLCAFLGVGYAGHQVDLAGLHLLQRIRPVGLYVVVLPAGVRGDGLFIFIAVAAALAVGAGDVVGGILIPCGADGVIRGGRRRQERNEQTQAQQQAAGSMQFLKESVHRGLLQLSDITGKFYHSGRKKDAPPHQQCSYASQTRQLAAIL